MMADQVEQKLFLEGIFLKYGYDFRDYAQASLARRIDAVQRKIQSTDLMSTTAKILRDKSVFLTILPLLTVGTSELFRDPKAFRALREKVIPVLKTYANINIWVAGCSTGEEIYSLAILLKEENLFDHSVIYATDINPLALKAAQEGIFGHDSAKTFAKNYVEAGGKSSPSDYYTADYGLVRFDPSLRENVVFSEHNLVADHVFTEAHLILCRNVLIYFNRNLQDRVLNLFTESLSNRGFLLLGSKETLGFSAVGPKYEVIDRENRVYQKVGRCA